MLKKKLKDTLKNKKGFTLAELLIVVAIIAILVAVSIPVFAGKLEKARQSTDQANERAARAAAVNKYLEEQVEIKGWFYDAKNGKLVDKKDDITAYGQSSKYPTDSSANKAKGNIIQVDVKDDGTVTITWVTPGNSPTPTPISPSE